MAVFLNLRVNSFYMKVWKNDMIHPVALTDIRKPQNVIEDVGRQWKPTQGNRPDDMCIKLATARYCLLSLYIVHISLTAMAAPHRGVRALHTAREYCHRRLLLCAIPPSNAVYQPRRESYAEHAMLLL